MSIRHKREPHNTAKPTEVPSGVWTPLSPRNQALRGDDIPLPNERGIWCGRILQPTVKYKEYPKLFG